MFLHLSVSHYVHRGVCIPACIGADTPLPSACWDTHTPCPVHAGIHQPPPLPRRPLLRTVRILLECILDCTIYPNLKWPLCVHFCIFGFESNFSNLWSNVNVQHVEYIRFRINQWKCVARRGKIATIGENIVAISMSLKLSCIVCNSYGLICEAIRKLPFMILCSILYQALKLLRTVQGEDGQTTVEVEMEENEEGTSNNNFAVCDFVFIRWFRLVLRLSVFSILLSPSTSFRLQCFRLNRNQAASWQFSPACRSQTLTTQVRKIQ